MTAIRELEEETGLRCKEKLHIFNHLQHLQVLRMKLFILYLAEELYEIENPAAGDEDEFIELLGSND